MNANRQCERCDLLGKRPAPATARVVLVTYRGMVGERHLGYVCSRCALDFPARQGQESAGYELRAERPPGHMNFDRGESPDDGE